VYGADYIILCIGDCTHDRTSPLKLILKIDLNINKILFKALTMSKKPYLSFDKLKPSTCTYIVHTNITLNPALLFDSINIKPIERKDHVNDICIDISSTDEPLKIKYNHTKKGSIVKKSIHAPYGTIFYAENSGRYKGIDLRKKISAVDEENRTRTKKIITRFLNQGMFYISIGYVNYNVMMFTNNCKIVGCKTEENAIEIMMVLWEEYFLKNPETWAYKNDSDKSIQFLFEGCMVNYGFKFDFEIDKIRYNNFMNNLSTYGIDSSEVLFQLSYHNDINVENVFGIKYPQDYKYSVLKYANKRWLKPVLERVPAPISSLFISELKSNERKKKSGNKTNTVRVFNSGRINTSGRIVENLRDIYNFLNDIAVKYKHMICVEEKKMTPFQF